MNTKIRTHKDLNVWKKAIDFVTRIYKETASFPKEERYGLGAQLRKSSVSIASNIAEGAGRSSSKELLQFLYIALGSLSEIETQLIIAVNLGFNISRGTQEESDVIRRMLLALIRAIKK